MPLSWLNGGDGVERGFIAALVNTDTGNTETIDLGDVATINDVIDRLNENDLGITAKLDSGSIVLTSFSGDAFSVADTSGSSTASDLGILGESSEGTFVGSKLAYLDGGLSLAALNDGNGVLVREGLADVRINTRNGRVFTVDFSSGTVVRIMTRRCSRGSMKVLVSPSIPMATRRTSQSNSSRAVPANRRPGRSI